MAPRSIFMSGGTGYMGQRLIPLLLQRGHPVRALARKGSGAKLPSGCVPVTGNALDKTTFTSQIQPAATFVQLAGSPSSKCSPPWSSPSKTHPQASASSRFRKSASPRLDFAGLATNRTQASKSSLRES